jgi:D-aminopeptidase
MRLRELGYAVGSYPTGKKNAIVDVEGVRVGHVTLNRDLPDGRAVRTGVTAILPHEGNVFQEKVWGACYVINGFGKTTGLVQLEELGLIESPIMLTNTLAVPAVTHGTIQYLLEQNPDIGTTTGTVNVITGECNDGYLNDIRGLHVTPEHAREAIVLASPDEVAEGSVGAGTGMSCLGYKGGVGTSSRIIQHGDRTFTVGALVVSNFGRERDLALTGWGRLTPPEQEETERPPDGSIMIVVATDAPLNERQCKRLAKRAAFGLARTGSYAAHGSGDIVIAFSTAQRIAHSPAEEMIATTRLHESSELLNHLFAMTAESVHEAILNSLCKADDMVGREGNRREAFPYRLLEIWKGRPDS